MINLGGSNIWLLGSIIQEVAIIIKLFPYSYWGFLQKKNWHKVIFFCNMLLGNRRAATFKKNIYWSNQTLFFIPSSFPRKKCIQPPRKSWKMIWQERQKDKKKKRLLLQIWQTFFRCCCEQKANLTFSVDPDYGAKKKQTVNCGSLLGPTKTGLPTLGKEPPSKEKLSVS